MLSDCPGVMCRPSRVRQMFASRACRKSVSSIADVNIHHYMNYFVGLGMILHSLENSAGKTFSRLRKERGAMHRDQQKLKS